MKLGLEFYNRDSISVAKDLLGKILVRNLDGKEIRTRIVEVEAYAGEEDKACHTYGGRRTKRTEVMYKRAGHLYVYFIYGMYYLSNVVTGDENSGEAVLIRAVEPLNEIDTISKNRFGKSFENLSSYQRKNLTNGPGKLTKALHIEKNQNGIDLLEDEIYIENDGFTEFEIVKTVRIGIDYAEEAKDFLYRFYIKGNKCISKE